jgi:hypothetical protein
MVVPEGRDPSLALRMTDVVGGAVHRFDMYWWMAA